MSSNCGSLEDEIKKITQTQPILTLIQPNNVAIPKYLICCFLVYLFRDQFEFPSVTQDLTFFDEKTRT